ncbi:DUF3618 domain-containing protein [Saccharopolyspora sp. TS4A08]|uniref:DUF3618 domain-containing protein n=2 Tax=Saccharopolyspora TaxID=1835 RepID=A0A1I6QES8_9PSEU|nr:MULTISPECIES: DUF3618 domain-containing protein [Saccharopolyspora]MDI2029880.1 DUF3618 domain-containing protein [Saccharopolyspora sp. TS4A08]SFS50944.1 Protein of unknown function [Saccharopolyspora flava]
MARDQDAIERDIEQARDALADTLDRLSVQANPQKFVDAGKASVKEKLNDPKVRYALIGVGALVTVVVVRKLFK